MAERVPGRWRWWLTRGLRTIAPLAAAGTLLLAVPVARDLGLTGLRMTGSTAPGPGGPIALAASPTSIAVVAHDPKHGTITSSEAGRPVHVSVRVTSAGGTPTGLVKVSWFEASASCKTTSVASATVALSGGVADVTALVATPMTPQSISFQADYVGDATFSPSTTCIAVTITKALPSMTTAVHDSGHNTVTSLYVTRTAHERVSVSGPAATPTGTVTIELLSGTDCTGFVFLTAVITLGATAVVEGGVYSSDTPSDASYRATYSGDAVYTSRTGTCRPIEWRKALPTFSLEIHQGTSHSPVFVSALQASLHPDATIGGPLGTPSGGLWRVFSYSDEDCGGNQIGSAVLPLTTGSVDDPAIILSSLSVPGIASYQTRYNGDARYLEGASQCIDVGMKGLVEVSLDVHDDDHQAITSATIFDAIHGSTTVTGDFDQPTGTVEFRLYAASGCASAFETITRTLSSGGVDDATADFVLASADFRSMMVHYQGNFDYFSNESSCRALPVGKATPTVQAQVHDAAHQVVSGVQPGTPVHARVTAGGVPEGTTPTGSVSVAFFTNGTCSGTAIAASGKVALSGGAADLTAFTQAPVTPGTYAFRPEFAGDAAYGTASGSCASFVVLAPGATPPPLPSPTPSAAPGVTAAPIGSDPAAGGSPLATTLPGPTSAPGPSGPAPGSGAPATDGGAGASPAGSAPPAGAAGGAAGPGGILVVLLGGLLLAAIAAAVLGFALGRRRRAGGGTPPGG